MNLEKWLDIPTKRVFLVNIESKFSDSRAPVVSDLC